MSYEKLFEIITPNNKQNIQWLGFCPFHKHNHKTPSFSVNIETGQWHCFACDEKGNAYQFNEKLKLGYSCLTINETKEKTEKSINVIKSIPDFLDFFDSNDLIKYCKSRRIDENIVLQLGIKWNDKENKLLFVIRHKDGSLNSFKTHKKFQTQGSVNVLYPYKNDRKNTRDIILCEGEIDVLSLLTLGYNACCFTGGCMSIPHLSVLMELYQYKKVIIIYDNDKKYNTNNKLIGGGVLGAKKIENQLNILKINTVNLTERLPENLDINDLLVSGNVKILINLLKDYNAKY